MKKVCDLWMASCGLILEPFQTPLLYRLPRPDATSTCSASSRLTSRPAFPNKLQLQYTRIDPKL